MTTIRDIAQAAGVSIGTVSNYLNDPDRVAEETRDRIARVVKQLDYHPRAAARSLKSRQTHRIGLVPIISTESDDRSNDPGDNAFLELLAGLNTLATENGFDILISGATNYKQEIQTYDRFVGEAQVDGLIIMGIHPQDERIRILRDKKFPFVAYGRSDLDFPYPFVDVDGASGIIEAVHHLAALGHKRIAYITPPADLMCASQRFEGFVNGMKQAGLGVREEYVISGGFFEGSGYTYTNELLDLAEPPTAIITANDVSAFGAMRALQERRLKVGRDISIIGFDDISLSEHWQPGLTTITQPVRKLGFYLMQTLFSVMADPNVLPQTVVPTRLIVRQTTGPCKNQ